MRATKCRTYKRDGWLGIRMPAEDKRRLFELGGRKRRDASSLALEFIISGLEKMEREQKAVAAGAN